MCCVMFVRWPWSEALQFVLLLASCGCPPALCSQAAASCGWPRLTQETSILYEQAAPFLRVAWAGAALCAARCVKSLAPSKILCTREALIRWATPFCSNASSEVPAAAWFLHT